ncbi:hypothetical protein LL06_21735 [Hoeflea sp. BAL378]|uniref:hypothetical protein n=1 Tax=Hoeflea sp. BAL378 TaxID=1547437 RepID=UPI00051382CE|nr:hypothetical protein [Hoeflea sp. BAL378]KGF67527.1 hypothetical protein LL06_21735 [Hoeflea sp. BAL378]
MSYYDHATMMALRLGPWADDPAAEQARNADRRRRRPGRGTPSLLAWIIGLAHRRAPAALRKPPEPAAAADSDAPRKT